MLEIPQSSDATIRLLKARIKSLEEQLGTALTLNQGAAVPVHAVKAVTTMAAYVLLVTPSYVHGMRKLGVTEALSCMHYGFHTLMHSTSLSLLKLTPQGNLWAW